jgi:hypothetical protein
MPHVLTAPSPNRVKSRDLVIKRLCGDNDTDGYNWLQSGGQENWVPLKGATVGVCFVFVRNEAVTDTMIPCPI